MAKVRNCVWVSPSSILTIAHNLFRQFLNVTFNEIFCILVLFLFYGTPEEYIASGNSWWLLWPKCWLETEFDCRFRLRFSQFNQLNQTNCGRNNQQTGQILTEIAELGPAETRVMHLSCPCIPNARRLTHVGFLFLH